jgi:hypothetical protein
MVQAAELLQYTQEGMKNKGFRRSLSVILRGSSVLLFRLCVYALYLSSNILLVDVNPPAE